MLRPDAHRPRAPLRVHTFADPVELAKLVKAITEPRNEAFWTTCPRVWHERVVIFIIAEPADLQYVI